MARDSLFGHQREVLVATVSGIKPLARDPNLRRIYVGRRAVATLRASDVEALGIRAGSDWTPALAAKVEHEAAAAKVRKRAMTMIARRAYSRKQLADLLIRKRHEAGVVQQVVDELAADHWIDDAAYARDVAFAIGSRKPAGARLLEARLADRQVDPQTARQAAREAAAEFGTPDAAEELVRRRLAMWRGLKPAVVRRRIESLLSRRGFNQDAIEAVLARLSIRAEDTE